MIEDEKKRAKAQPISEPISAPANEPEIQDVDLGFVEKRKFRIGGDYNRILELNVSDMNIYSRFTKAYPQLQELSDDATKKVSSISVETDDDEALKQVSDILEEIDNKMRDLVDYIFDTNASEVCAPSGNMFDPVNGSFRFEHIISTLSKLYLTGFEDEVEKFKKKTAKYTNKYTKKYHK